MDGILLFVFLILGFLVGSFLNVVIFRLGTEDKIVNSRSKCLGCGHQLAWYDLFPVLSFLSLGGKCRYCRRPISWQYPAVETATGILYAGIFARVLGGGDYALVNLVAFAAALFAFSAVVVIFVYDLRHYIIPDRVVFPAMGVVLASLLLRTMLAGGGTDWSLLVSSLEGSLLAGGFFLILIYLTEGKGMGGGDAKLGFLIGLVLGFPQVLLALFVAFVSGAVIGVLLMALKKKKMKSMVPFGPFLVLGMMLSFFFGQEIMGWYLGSFWF